MGSLINGNLSKNGDLSKKWNFSTNGNEVSSCARHTDKTLFNYFPYLLHYL